nr:hypothetical protein DM860_005930 [Ipomoea batatas]
MFTSRRSNRAPGLPWTESDEQTRSEKGHDLEWRDVEDYGSDKTENHEKSGGSRAVISHPHNIGGTGSRKGIKLLVEFIGMGIVSTRDAGVHIFVPHWIDGFVHGNSGPQSLVSQNCLHKNFGKPAFVIGYQVLSFYHVNSQVPKLGREIHLRSYICKAIMTTNSCRIRMPRIRECLVRLGSHPNGQHQLSSFNLIPLFVLQPIPLWSQRTIRVVLLLKVAGRAFVVPQPNFNIRIKTTRDIFRRQISCFHNPDIKATQHDNRWSRIANLDSEAWKQWSKIADLECRSDGDDTTTEKMVDGGDDVEPWSRSSWTADSWRPGALEQTTEVGEYGGPRGRWPGADDGKNGRWWQGE